MPLRRLDHVAARGARQVGVVEHDAPSASGERLVERLRELLQAAAPLVAVETHVLAGTQLLRCARFAGARYAHHENHLALAQRLPPSARNRLALDLDRRRARRRPRRLRAARAGNRDDHGRESEQPCERELRLCRIDPA